MDEPRFELFIPGICRSSGSKRVFPHKSGIPILAPAGEHEKSWKDAVGWSFMEKYGKLQKIFGPVKIELVFCMARPRSHYRVQNGQISPYIKPTAPKWAEPKPDIDKLMRAVLDSLTGLAWHDDSQVCLAEERKVYSETPGVQIRIWPLAETEYPDGPPAIDNTPELF
jgi:crossover junction endodeoxyribonuclease RusA